MFAIITHTIQLLSFTFGQNYINVKLGKWWKDRNMDRLKIYKLLRMGVSVIVSNLVIEHSYRKGSKTMFSAGILVGLATHIWLGIDTYKTAKHINQEVNKISSMVLDYIPSQGMIASYNVKF